MSTPEVTYRVMRDQLPKTDQYGIHLVEFQPAVNLLLGV